MKKFMAVLVMTAMLCSFASCGESEESSKAVEKSSVSEVETTVAEESEEETTVETTIAEESEEETTAETDSSDESEEDTKAETDSNEESEEDTVSDTDSSDEESGEDTISDTENGEESEITANTLFMSAMTALLDVDFDDIAIPESCIISNDSSKNVNADDEFLTAFEKYIKDYLPEYNTFDCFILIENHDCAYVAMDNGGTVLDSPAGTYSGSYEEIYQSVLSQIDTGNSEE